MAGAAGKGAGGRLAARKGGSGLCQLTFMFMAESGSSPLIRRELGANEAVKVRDQATRSIQHLRAGEVSLYRHT